MSTWSISTSATFLTMFECDTESEPDWREAAIYTARQPLLRRFLMCLIPSISHAFVGLLRFDLLRVGRVWG